MSRASQNTGNERYCSLVRWREEKARGVTYIRYSMPENSSTVSRPAGIAVMNADKSLRRSLDMMVLCADFGE